MELPDGTRIRVVVAYMDGAKARGRRARKAEEERWSALQREVGGTGVVLLGDLNTTRHEQGWAGEGLRGVVAAGGMSIRGSGEATHTRGGCLRFGFSRAIARGARTAAERAVSAERHGTLPAVPPGADLKEEDTVPPVPPGTFVKEEGPVSPMPPDAFVNVEVVVKEEQDCSEARPKRQRTE